MGWKVKHRSDQNKSQVILFEARAGWYQMLFGNKFEKYCDFIEKNDLC